MGKYRPWMPLEEDFGVPKTRGIDPRNENPAD